MDTRVESTFKESLEADQRMLRWEMEKKKKKSVPDLAKQNVRGSFLTNWSYQHPMPITSLFYGFINGSLLLLK